MSHNTIRPSVLPGIPDAELDHWLGATPVEAIMLGIPGLGADTFTARLETALKVKDTQNKRPRNMPYDTTTTEPQVFGIDLLIEYAGDALHASRQTRRIRTELIHWFGLTPQARWCDADAGRWWIYDNPAAPWTLLLTECARIVAADVRRGDGTSRIPARRQAPAWWRHYIAQSR